jgi:uncharacterized protein YndB with AHSA1/START domain
MSDQDAADRTLVITRVIDAPAHILFLAYSDCAHIKRWFGPVGWPVTSCEMDFRVGGQYRFAMTGPSGVANDPFGGTYHEIVADRKIVFDNAFLKPGSGKMVMTVTFEEASEGKTTLTLVTLFESSAMKTEYVGMGFVQGTNSGLDQLADLAAELKAA